MFMSMYYVDVNMKILKDLKLKKSYSKKEVNLYWIHQCLFSSAEHRVRFCDRCLSAVTVIQMVPISCNSWSQGPVKIGHATWSSSLKTFNIKKSFHETAMHRDFIFGTLHHLEVLYQSFQSLTGVRIGPAPGSPILNRFILWKPLKILLS